MKKLDTQRTFLAMLAIATGNLLGAQTFTRIIDGPVVTTPGDSRSVNWVDVNNDDLIDLFISNGKSGGQDNVLYLNEGGGIFTQVSSDPIVQDSKPSDGATFADVDNDGDLDAFVVNWYAEDNMYYVKNASAEFEQYLGVPMAASGGYSETAAWGDYDNDGLLDLYVTRSGSTAATRRNQLYHNDGMNGFTKILTGDAVTNSFTSRSVNWTDIDNDGDLDLFVTNEGASNNNENIYRNDGGGNFTRITDGPLVNNGAATMSSSWGDYDNDGDLDVFLANYNADNALFRNDGNMVFTKLTADPVTTASYSFSSAWGDIDNDGDLDLYVTNSYNPASAALVNFLYLNNGDGSFTKVEEGAPVTEMSWSYGCAFGDYDNDGFQDLAVATTAFNNVDETDFLYHNDGNDNNWITIKLTGTTTNKSAIGTKIRVNAQINGVPVTQMREISAQSSYCGQNDLRAHFGLGNAAVVNSITLEWLGGTPEVFNNVAANQFITIVQGQGLNVNDLANKNFSVFPNPAKNTLNIHSRNGSEIKAISVYNMLGQMVHAEAGNVSEVDISELQTGRYFIKVTSDKGTATAKFIKD